MKTFVDTQERTWSVAVNVTAMKRVRDLCKVDLMDAVTDGGKLLERLTLDPVLLCDVIFALCRDQAVKDGVSDEAFGSAMAGDPIEDATTALLEELVNFFPETKRPVFALVVSKIKKYRNMATAAVRKRIEDPALDKRIETLIEQTIGDAFNDLPSSGSTPTAAQESSD